MELEPDYTDAHFNLGLAYMLDGQKDEAAREFKRVLELRPGDIEAQKALDVLQ